MRDNSTCTYMKCTVHLNRHDMSIVLLHCPVTSMANQSRSAIFVIVLINSVDIFSDNIDGNFLSLYFFFVIFLGLKSGSHIINTFSK